MWGLHSWFRQHAHLTTALTPRQSVFINITSLMTSPYLLLVTGSLRSNRSRAKCTAQVGMSYRLCSYNAPIIQHLYTNLHWGSEPELRSSVRNALSNPQVSTFIHRPASHRMERMSQRQWLKSHPPCYSPKRVVLYIITRAVEEVLGSIFSYSLILLSLQ